MEGLRPLRFFGGKMKVAITARQVLDDKKGLLRKGQIVELPDSKARFFIERGEAELYQTKVLRERPSLAAGESASASPAAQALPQTMLPASEPGKKRGRPKKASS